MMSLLQQLSSAALAATADAAQDNADPSCANSSSSSSSSTAQVLLEQLTASIVAIQEHQQQHQRQRQQGSASLPAQTHAHAAASDSASKFVQDVQAGLQATNEQLQRLLAQRANTCCELSILAALQHPPSEQQQQPATTAAPAPAQVGCTTTSSSTAVLQKLLQLAAGDSSCTATTLAQDQGVALTPHDTAGQQQRQQEEGEGWRTAALEALQLFSFEELEQLPPHSLQQALLLQPQLLDRFLEAAAAAVLKPLLTIPQAAAAAAEDRQPPGPQSHLAGPADVGEHQTSQPPVAAAAAAGSNSTGSWSGAAGGMQNMQSLLAASRPWMQSLPGMLAHHPILLLRASSTLLGWLEASGHTRLWQLLSSTCRPAWQQLAATAPSAPLDPHTWNGRQNTSPADALAAPAPAAAQAGSLQLLCPHPWQQQLVLLLVEEPSVLGMLHLLQQLPGLALQEDRQHHHHPPYQQQQRQPTGQHKTGGQGMTSDADQVLENPWCSGALLAWPSAQEWGQPAPLQVASEGDSSQQGPAVHDRAQVLLAWGLVMQHHCWYQFACSLLLSSSLHYLQQEQDHHKHLQQRQQPQQAEGWSQAPKLLQQLLQMPAQELLQQYEGLPTAQLAAAGAAAFIAWVHQPVAVDRQAALQEQLLSAVTAAAVSSCSSQPAQPPPLRLAACLLNSWKASLCGQTQLPPAQPDMHEPPQQQQTDLQSTTAAEAPSSLQHSRGWVTPVLFAENLPCAVLQQRELLLQCSTQELVNLCLTAASWGVLSANDAAPTAAALAAGTGDNSVGSPGLPSAPSKGCLRRGVGGPGSGAACDARVSNAALCHLLDCSNQLCAAALEVVNLTLQHKMQQQRPSSIQLSWLARQWLSDGAGADSTADVGSVVPGLTVAKQLLAAATGIDQCLKQHGG